MVCIEKIKNKINVFRTQNCRVYLQKESAYSKYNLVSEDILYSWDILTRKGCAGFGEKICVFFFCMVTVNLKY